MARIDNLNEPEMAQVLRRLKALETAAPLGRSAISRGALRILSPEGLIVKGSASVTGVLKGVGSLLWDGIVTLTSTFTAKGTALFTGLFTARGTTRFEGDTTQVGPFHVTGATDITGALTAKGMTRFEGDTTQVGAHHVQGNQDITGTLAVKGATTLEALITLMNNMIVNSGGKITIDGSAPLTLGIGPNGLPAMFFSSGSSIEGTATGARMVSSGSPYVEASSNSARIVSGSFFVSASITGIDMGGLQPKAGAGANLHIDSAGKLWRTS